MACASAVEGRRAVAADLKLKIGDVQGLPYRANLGDTGGAMTSYRKGLQIAEGTDSAALIADLRPATPRTKLPLQ